MNTDVDSNRRDPSDQTSSFKENKGGYAKIKLAVWRENAMENNTTREQILSALKNCTRSVDQILTDCGSSVNLYEQLTSIIDTYRLLDCYNPNNRISIRIFELVSKLDDNVTDDELRTLIPALFLAFKINAFYKSVLDSLDTLSRAVNKLLQTHSYLLPEFISYLSESSDDEPVVITAMSQNNKLN